MSDVYDQAVSTYLKFCIDMVLWAGVFVGGHGQMDICTRANSLDASLINTSRNVLLKTGTQLFKPVNLGAARM